MFSKFLSLFLAASAATAFAGNMAITPTTTVSELTSNNTSASSTFKGTSNGNAAPGNVSKLPLRELLYSGSKTKIYVHVQPWWGKSSHIDIGYKSTDPAQAEKQVVDMISRGIDGVMMDWYGQDNAWNEKATEVLFNAVEDHPNFEFAISYDSNALKGCSSATSKIISDLKFAYSKYMHSSHYLRRDNRPLVTFFGTEAYSIDWNKVRSSVPGNMIFTFRNSSGFTRTQSNGAFGWVGISGDANNMGLSYLDNFYSKAVSMPSKYEVGSSYKGFNDKIASWSQKRVVNQQCGQTWLATWAAAGKRYSSSKQLDSLQIVTWNDYEEGTQIETGIDNCVTVTASMSGSTLNWKISGGKENTIDHYEIYTSKDGKSLMKLTEQNVGIRSMNMSSYAFATGKYYMHVYAVGKPGIKNKMASAVTMTR